VHSDAVARWYGGLLYVVNRFGGDNIQVIDPAQNYATIRQFSVGNGSNPQDIVFVSPTKAYVSRYGSSDVLVVNPAAADGAPMTPISLAAFNDQDGLPEMVRMIRVERYLFVACQRLDNFQPTNPSVVVVIDTQTDAVVDVDGAAPGVQGIALALRNPVTAFAFDRAQSRLWLGCAGTFGVPGDGGVEAIDPFVFASLGPVITGAELGGDVNDIAWRSPAEAYALVAPDFSSNRLVSWDPATGQTTDTLLVSGSGFGLPDLELNDRGELYVCRNTFTAQEPPGLLVFSTATHQLLAGPLDTGLPPVCVVFDEATDAATSVPLSNDGLEFAAPWPNPSRAPVRLAFRLGRAADVDVRVYDATGRAIRTLATGSREAGRHDLVWDLADDRGASAKSGIYFVRVSVDGASRVRRVAVVR
jgi:DNA-binding beta-propeller fold protein YncE